MNNESNHIAPYELIGKYLALQASQLEISELEKWVKESPEHEKLFLEYKRLWVMSEFSKANDSIDVESEWKKLKSKLFAEDVKVKSLYENTRSGIFSPLLRYAAIFITLIALAGVFYLLFSKPEMEELTATNSIITTQLPDGSEVTLNLGSKLIFPSKFKGDTRSLKLEGDAFFKVTPDKTKTFIVQASQVVVKVLGTSFYLNAKAEQPDVQVTVNSGKVSFGAGTEQVILIAGEQGIFDKEKGTIDKMANEDENFISWKTKKMVFHNEKLEVVFRKIEQTYGTTIIIISPEILECRLTATFDNQSLERVMEILKATFNLEISQQEGLINVAGVGCNN
jgi:ferric-dicitrate binding protein FerR (iron transport regulator)